MDSILKILREQNGYSQDEIAQKVGITRQTYNKYEKNCNIQDLTIIQKLANIFNVDYTCIIDNKRPQEIVYNIIGREKRKEINEIRVDIPIENIEKFKQVFLYILSKVGAKPNIGQTVIYKLLYFIDFDYYELFETQLMGLKYIKNHYGPSPIDFAKIVKTMESDNQIEVIHTKRYNYDMTKYLPLVEPDLNMLSAQELTHINKILEKYSDKTAAELSAFSHKDIPWIAAKDNEVIEYEAVFYRNSDTSVRKYDEDY